MTDKGFDLSRLSSFLWLIVKILDEASIPKKCHNFGPDPPLPLKFVKLPILFNFNAYLHDSEHEQEN